jgi:hypothetical protein
MQLKLQIKKNIAAQINKQLVYKKTSLGGRVSVQIDNCPVAVFLKIFPEKLISSGSNGPKQIKFSATPSDFGEAFDQGFGGFSKGLRYGASLEFNANVNVTFSKSDGAIKISGTYKMTK